MNHDGANNWATRIKFGALFVVVLGVAGLLTDVSFGLPLTRESKSWAGWLFGILGLGALYLAGEGVAEWIHARDTVKDPLRKRVWHLALLLAVVVVFWLVSAALLSVNQ
jgi:hypothetical protein